MSRHANDQLGQDDDDQSPPRPLSVLHHPPEQEMINVQGDQTSIIIFVD